MKFSKLHISFSLVLLALLSATGISQPNASTYVYQDSATTTSNYSASDRSKAFVFEEPGSYQLQNEQEKPGFYPIKITAAWHQEKPVSASITSIDIWSYLQDQKSRLETQIFPFHYFT